MYYEGYSPPIGLIRQAANEEAVLLRRPNGLYEELAQATARAYDSLEQNNVLLTPAVEFLTRTALRTLRRPDVAPHLPSEVQERACAAQLTVVNLCQNIGRSLLLDYYGAHRSLQAAVDHDTNATGEINGLLALPQDLYGYAAPPFHDGATVVGGALRFLNKRVKRLGESSSGVIKRSTGLLYLSGIPLEQSRYIDKAYGLPYIGIGNFRIVGESTARTIAFLPDVIKDVRSLFADGSGCPARRVIVSEQGDGASPPTNALVRMWPELAGYLLPPNATVRSNADMTINPAMID